MVRGIKTLQLRQEISSIYLKSNTEIQRKGINVSSFTKQSNVDW